MNQHPSGIEVRPVPQATPETTAKPATPTSLSRAGESSFLGSLSAEGLKVGALRVAAATALGLGVAAAFAQTEPFRILGGAFCAWLLWPNEMSETPEEEGDEEDEDAGAEWRLSYRDSLVQVLNEHGETAVSHLRLRELAGVTRDSVLSVNDYAKILEKAEYLVVEHNAEV